MLRRTILLAAAAVLACSSDTRRYRDVRMTELPRSGGTCGATYLER